MVFLAKKIVPDQSVIFCVQWLPFQRYQTRQTKWYKNNLCRNFKWKKSLLNRLCSRVFVIFLAICRNDHLLKSTKMSIFDQFKIPKPSEQMPKTFECCKVAKFGQIWNIEIAGHARHYFMQWSLSSNPAEFELEKDLDKLIIHSFYGTIRIPKVPNVTPVANLINNLR